MNGLVLFQFAFLQNTGNLKAISRHSKILFKNRKNIGDLIDEVS
jgi:hypothetical protein